MARTQRAKMRRVEPPPVLPGLGIPRETPARGPPVPRGGVGAGEGAGWEDAEEDDR